MAIVKPQGSWGALACPIWHTAAAPAEAEVELNLTQSWAPNTRTEAFAEPSQRCLGFGKVQHATKAGLETG